MGIKQAEFLQSNTDIDKCPPPDKPEYAFIGRSNVGKSTLINALTNQRHLAKTSGTPGKTQLINHFLINQAWYLVDLPGYGYAKVSKTKRGEFDKIIKKYILHRTNLVGLFVLIDCRHEAQKNDLEFLTFLGENEIPFAIVFTKIDKLSSSQLHKKLHAYKKTLLNTWAELPAVFQTSGTGKHGINELVAFIEQTNETVENSFNKK